MDVQAPTTVASLTLYAPTLTSFIIPTISTVTQAPTPPTTAPSNLLQDLPNFGSLFGFDHRLKTLEANFSEFMQTNQFDGAVSSILEIVQRYMDQRMNEAAKVAVQIQFDSLCDEAQAENKEFLKNLDENIQKIIKEQVKEHVKTSYTVAADLSEMELRKILIEKIEGNKSIHRSDEQRNLYKALVEAYESDKIILDTYGDAVTLRIRHDDDANKDEKPSAGSDMRFKRRRKRKEPESTSAPKEKATRTTGKSTQGSISQQRTASESGPAEEPLQTTHDLEEPSHQEFVTGAADDQPPAEASQHPEWFQQQRKPPTPDRHRVISFNHFINNDLEYLRGGAYSHKYTTFVTKTKAVDYGQIKWIEDLVPHTMWSQEHVSYDKHALWGISHWGRKRQQFYGFAVNKEYARDVYSKRRIIAVTELQIVEWHNYKHLDWITVRRDDDKLYTTLGFQVSLRMFTRSIVIQRRVKDLQLGVESYQKKLNLTRPDTYHFDLKRKEAYTAYSNPRGFIYRNKDKQNRLMRIDELHKFNDRTLNDVRTALDDRLKGIRMKYLLQTIWRKSDKERAVVMIQAIDK
nr:hypothetical protein [Tanacetum cinerariifolium]